MMEKIQLDKEVQDRINELRVNKRIAKYLTLKGWKFIEKQIVGNYVIYWWKHESVPNKYKQSSALKFQLIKDILNEEKEKVKRAS